MHEHVSLFQLSKGAFLHKIVIVLPWNVITNAWLIGCHILVACLQETLIGFKVSWNELSSVRQARQAKLDAQPSTESHQHKRKHNNSRTPSYDQRRRCSAIFNLLAF